MPGGSPGYPALNDRASRPALHLSAGDTESQRLVGAD